jgi:hypothetical protein
MVRRYTGARSVVRSEVEYEPRAGKTSSRVFGHNPRAPVNALNPRKDGISDGVARGREPYHSHRLLLFLLLTSSHVQWLLMCIAVFFFFFFVVVVFLF